MTAATGSHRTPVALAIAIARIGLGVLFAVAAVGKLQDPAQLAEDIANYRVVPAALVGPLTVTLPGVELVVGALLMLGVYTRAAACLAAAMLAAFTLGLVQSLARGVDLACGCFGGAPEPATIRTVVRDLALFGVAVAVATLDRGALSAAGDAPAE